jgi:Protein of unknown function (DUF3108)
MRSSLSLLLGVCLAVGAGLSNRAAANPAVDAHYAVQTMGVDLGRAALRLDKLTDGLATKFRFETDALLGLVEASDTRMQSESAVARDVVSPRTFEGVYQKEDRTREVGMAYGAKGEIDRFQLVKRGKVRIDHVPQGLAPDTLDPLAAFLRARAWLGHAPEGAELVLAVFDGRKRYDASLRYLGLTQLAGDQGTAPAHRVAVRYLLVEALNEDSGVLELEAANRPRELELAVSADGRFVPLRVEGSLDGVPISAVLAADCAGPGGCPD